MATVLTFSYELMSNRDTSDLKQYCKSKIMNVGQKKIPWRITMVSAAQIGLFIAALLYYLMRKPKDSSSYAPNNDNKDSDTSDNTENLGEK